MNEYGLKIIRDICTEIQKTRANNFSVDELVDIVVDVARKTSGNTNSMLVDIRNKKKTEIDYINGYFRLHNTPVNNLLIDLVSAKERIKSW